MGRLSDLCRFFTNESGAAGNSWKESNNRWAISDRITLNGGTDMAVSAKSVIQGIFVEAALSPQMSMVAPRLKVAYEQGLWKAAELDRIAMEIRTIVRESIPDEVKQYTN